MRKPFCIIPLLLATSGPPNLLADTITITSIPNATSLPSGTGTLTDSAVLSGANSPTGKITFTLSFEGTVVDTETVTVSGDGAYTTPTGFTLPTVGPVDGVYQWDVTYSGDSNNSAVSDINDPNEQVVVGPVAAAPEPGTLILMALGFVGLVGIQRRKKLSSYLP